MVLKLSKRETTFSIEISSDSECIWSENSENLYESKTRKNSLDKHGTLKFGQQAPCYTLLQRKMNFQQKRTKNLNSF
jgi:hypothetical protein